MGLTEPSIPIQVPEPAREPRYVPMPDPDPIETPEPAPVHVPEREPVPA